MGEEGDIAAHFGRKDKHEPEGRLGGCIRILWNYRSHGGSCCFGRKTLVGDVMVSEIHVFMAPPRTVGVTYFGYKEMDGKSLQTLFRS